MSKRIPTYRLHKPTGLAVVTLDGKDHYLGRHGTAASRAAYERLVAQWLLGRGKPTPAAPAPDLTVDEVLLRYWTFAQSYYGRASKQVDNMKLALRPLRHLYGTSLAPEFGPLALKAVRQRMIDLGWYRNYVNHCVGRLKRVFRWAAENELLPPSVYASLQAVRGLSRNRSEARETAPVQPVAEAHVQAALPHVSDTVRAMVLVQQLTGCRPGEVVRMRGVDLDMAGDVWLYRPAGHKTAHHGHGRVVAIGPRAQEVIRPFLKEDPERYLFSPRESRESWNAERRRRRKTPVTPSQARRRRKPSPKRAPGERYTVGTYRNAIRRACIRAGVPVWHPHQIRHAVATELRRRYGLETAKAVLGHRTLSATEVYAQKDLAGAVRVMGEVG
jgi:integrase